VKAPAFFRKNALHLWLIFVFAILITVTGICYRQSFLRILPLYISLIIGALQAHVNRFASLLGGCNSVLYTAVYFYLGLYASAASAFLFFVPLQFAAFFRWSKHKYKQATVFRTMSGRMRAAVLLLMAAAFGIVLYLLKRTGSAFPTLDALASLVGSTVPILTMFAYIEYTWLMLPSGILNICLNAATMTEHPAQITYLIYSVYSLICVTMQFFRAQKLYAEQNAEQIHKEETKP